ncbi:Fe-S cluster assembly protein SufD [Sneathiella chinensis]|uniref:Fe-S cluster assembly protein SufD n=1 Tax=Sneathiella chinensis TaxID=349750 RepID=A0ABQ5U5E1_9PROT|nr:Fe-S cluster assembly protein SufD [Sneathiella chinensis]GLQ06976.1 Fe-S cluster assembly protein SufD [Sneathiella chinensis]
MSSLTPLAQRYIDRFDTAARQLPGADNRSVSDLRRAGLEAFAALDFPHRKVEEWKFTNLTALTKPTANEGRVAPAPAPAIPDQPFEARFEMVFVNGRFSAAESRLDGLPEGISVTSLADSLGNGTVLSFPSQEKRAFLALNTAFMEDGLVLSVAEGVVLDDILVVTFRSEGDQETGRHLRNVITLAEGSSLTLLERHVGAGAYFSNPVTEVSLAADARLDHYKLQAESPEAFHLAFTDAELAERADYRNFSLSIGAKLSRNELTTRILGREAESHLNGAYLMRGSQHCDTTTLTEHRVPDTNSSQVYKGVLDDHAHGVFQGKIHIFPDAQHVAGDQLSKALLLSDYAAVDCKPELEIYADDVKCSHGATSGELDEQALFYLQSRGIPLASARKMLIEAFLADVLETVGNERVKVYFDGLSRHWLSEA